MKKPKMKKERCGKKKKILLFPNYITKKKKKKFPHSLFPKFLVLLNFGLRRVCRYVSIGGTTLICIVKPKQPKNLKKKKIPLRFRQTHQKNWNFPPTFFIPYDDIPHLLIYPPNKLLEISCLPKLKYSANMQKKKINK